MWSGSLAWMPDLEWGEEEVHTRRVRLSEPESVRKPLRQGKHSSNA